MSSELYVLAPNGPRTLGDMHALMEGADGLEPAHDAEFLERLSRFDRHAGGFVYSWISTRRRSRGFAESDIFHLVLRLRMHLAARDDAWEPIWRSAFGGRALAIRIDPPPPGFEVDELRNLVGELAIHFRLRVYDPRADVVHVGRTGLLRRFRRPDPMGP